MSGRHRYSRAGLGWPARVQARVLVAAVATALSGAILASGGAAPARAIDSDASAVTVSGTGEFASLKVTVGQTANLINQVVRVSWTGGTPTAPSTGSFNVDYLQVMQCWGDEATGPAREQCQFGALYGDARGGPWAASRQTSYGQALTDPDETYLQPPGTYTPVFVPFRSVTGKAVTGALNEFYDSYSSNEVPFGRTGADGTGQEFFEMQTAREAPGLGCGERLADGTGRSCWLVVVPRGETEVNGLPVAQTPFNAIASSPLSATNWAHRIVVPLRFQPIGLACPIGSAERRTLGQESVAEAMVRWQPALCKTGSIFGYSQVADDLARTQVLTETPGLAFVSRPQPDHPEVVYAPVALSGLTVAFDLEQASAREAPPGVKAHDGERITDLRLTARLLAKLLTQSYVAASFAPPDAMKGNPYDLTRDPDFLALNPAFRDFYFNGIADVVVPLGLSDATRGVWDWLASDRDAKAFLDGAPDPWGMVVNPYYTDLDLPRADFPKSDPGCQEFGDGRPALCTLDAHAYAADLHEAARGAARGDTQARTLWDPTASPPAWRKAPLQLSGSRAVIVLADSATAERYSLDTAALRNAAGAFVKPDSGGLLAGLGAAKPGGAPGVVIPDPATTNAAAYPLTTVTYAATVPSRLAADDAKAYAALLRYAVGDGQVPGTDVGRLSPGYVPLPASLRTQARSAATLVEHRWAPPAVAPTSVSPPIAPTVVAPRADVPAAPAAPPATAPVPSVAPTAAPVPSRASVAPAPIVAAGSTPAVPVGPARYALVGALLLGAAASVAGPSVRRVASRASGVSPLHVAPPHHPRPATAGRDQLREGKQ